MPDLTRLVRSISEALGPHATPERVEAASRAALRDLAQCSRDETDPTSARKRLAIVVVGYTGADLTQALGDLLTDAGCKILRVEIQDESPGQSVTWISVPDSGFSIPELRKRADAVAARHGARADVQHETLFWTLHPSLLEQGGHR